MSNTGVMGVCTVAIAFWLLGKAIKRKIEGKR